MNNKQLSALAFTAALGVAGAADATLYDRGNGLIYDDVLNITWLQNANYAATELTDARRDAIITAVNIANPSWLTFLGSPYTLSASDFGSDGSGNYYGRMTWFGAMAWADQLSYGGYTDWRLPTTLQPDPSCYSQYDPGGSFPVQGFSYDCTGSEMGRMFYNNMGASAGSSILTGSNTANLALFTNIQSHVYWSGTEYAPNAAVSAWFFRASDGNQDATSKDGEFYAWAVRPGDVAAPPSIPEPGSLTLVGLGLAGLGWARRRRG